MFERFTDRARRVIVLAQEEARLLNHNYIGTEHILLGLIGEGEGVAARALGSLGIEPVAVRRQVLEIVGSGVGVAQAPTGHIPFTPRAKKVLEFSLREGLQLGHNYIGTEHILLGLVREGEGVAAQVLASLGADLETVRMRVAELLAGSGDERVDAPPMPGVEGTQVAIGIGRGPRVERPQQTCAVCGRDLWDAERYVRAANAFLCDMCVADAARGLDASDDRVVLFPPRGFDSSPPSREDLAEIQRAFTEGFGGDVTRIEDGERLASVGEQVAANHPRISAEYIVERVRSDGPDAAEVAFTLFVQPLGMVIPETGRVRRVDGRWIVARETYLAVMARGGGGLQP